MSMCPTCSLDGLNTKCDTLQKLRSSCDEQHTTNRIFRRKVLDVGAGYSKVNRQLFITLACKKSWMEQHSHLFRTDSFTTRSCICISHFKEMYAPKKRIRGHLLRRAPVTKETFAEIIIIVRKNLHDMAGVVAKEIRDRFPRDELLDAMSIVYPQFWITTHDEHHKHLKQIDFKSKLRTLKDHFCKTATIGSETLCNIIDGNALMEQSQCFGETMWAQCAELEKPKEFGSITRLWLFLSNSQFLQDRMPEYFRLVLLCQTMILGSVEDERVFSTMNYLKNKVRNRLENNLDIALRSYTCRYSLKDFPFDRALALWDSTSRRESQALSEMPICSEALDSEGGWSALH